MPLNHVAPNGTFECVPPAFACPDTRFDTCLAHVTCDPLDAKGCAPTVQLQLASYLACFEGPFANREVRSLTRTRTRTLEPEPEP